MFWLCLNDLFIVNQNLNIIFHSIFKQSLTATLESTIEEISLIFIIEGPILSFLLYGILRLQDKTCWCTSEISDIYRSREKWYQNVKLPFTGGSRGQVGYYFLLLRRYSMTCCCHRQTCFPVYGENSFYIRKVFLLWTTGQWVTHSARYWWWTHLHLHRHFRW